ncbi:MAG: FAD-dependent oxidoreductase, partial [Acidimicrobiales bacterium]|nr:FAD-dependent oxidoreductase [Acidimicrobiales bacterium]
MTTTPRRVVVVGASLAAIRAADAFRRAGFEGSLTLVGDEPHQPYDRPPLSKDVLAGQRSPSTTRLHDDDKLAELGIEWRLGVRAESLDVDAGRVALADGDQLPFDRLLIATGARPRRLPGTDGVAGVHTLRTLDDCEGLRADLEAGPRRVVVVGAGFIGAEVAATCRGLDLDVTLLEAAPVPLERALGERMGLVCAEVHREHGVDVRLGVGVESLRGTNRVEAVVLADGTVVEADVVLVGIGVTPNTEWLEGSGLTIDNGVVCDATTLAAPGICAAGDVARWPNGRFGGEVMRVEHWDNAVEMGAHAARRLLADDHEAEAYEPVPW